MYLGRYGEDTSAFGQSVGALCQLFTRLKITGKRGFYQTFKNKSAEAKFSCSDD